MNTLIIVPGIGFPQTISVGPNGSYLEALREPTPCRETNDQHDAPIRGPKCRDRIPLGGKSP